MATPNIPDWAPSTAYNIGDVFVHSGIFYEVTAGYTSGGSFGALEASNATTKVDVQTFMTFDEWRQIGNQAYQKCFDVETELNNTRSFAVAMAIALGS